MITRLLFVARIAGGMLAFILTAASIGIGLATFVDLRLFITSRLTLWDGIVFQWIVLLFGGLIGLMAYTPIDYGDALFADERYQKVYTHTYFDN